MKVVIKEREFEYQSDYPNDWYYSAGDYFKFPVEIGKNKCFVKRFEKKSPESVSGWLFMNALKGKYEKNLPRLHDIVTVSEKNKDVQYIFYDFIEGTTLDKIPTPPSEINLQKLTDDIFNALNAVHKYNFWFADFCEKNIFCKNNGQFFLVDLDSVQPNSIAPNNDIYGSKDYWVVVYKFYNDILGMEDLKLSDIDGKLLNKLQVIFLILNIKLAGVKSQLNYSTGKDFDHLPTYLENIDPAFGVLFEKVFKNQDLDSATIDDEIKKLISENIINNNLDNIQEARTGDVVINNFKTNNLKPKHDESFVLSWEIENVKKLGLYRNDKPVKGITIKNNNIQISEKAYDGKPAKVEFYLIASNNKTQIKSDIITISVEPKQINFIPPMPDNLEEISDSNEDIFSGTIEPDKDGITLSDENKKDRPPKPPKKKRTLLYASIGLILALIAFYYFKKSNDNPTETIIIPEAIIDSVTSYTPEPVVDSALIADVKADTVAAINPIIKKISEKIKKPKKGVVTTTTVTEEIIEEEEEEEQKQPNYPQKEVTPPPKASGIDLNDIKDKIEFVAVRGGLLNLGKVKGYVLKNNSNFDIKQIKIEAINANNNEAKSFVFDNIKHQSKSSPQKVGDDFKLFTSKNGKSFIVVSVD
jgi:hypothetical protein